jgi:hypothetical protein
VKPYPTNELHIDEDELGPSFIAYVPTEEAVKNFLTYLEPEELAKYESASDTIKLHIALSVNPFMAFKYVLGSGVVE